MNLDPFFEEVNKILEEGDLFTSRKMKTVLHKKMCFLILHDNYGYSYGQLAKIFDRGRNKVIDATTSARFLVKNDKEAMQIYDNVLCIATSTISLEVAPK